MAGNAKEINRNVDSCEWGTNSNKVEVADMITKEEFSYYLECPVCLDVPIPPVYLCVTGHIICGVCIKQVKSCGLCSGLFSGARNFFYENLFEKTTFLCRYSIDGCSSKVLGKDLKTHQDKCDFRPLPCIKYGCPHLKEGNIIPFSKFVEHFVQAHDAKVNKTNLGKVSNGYPKDADSWVVSRWAHEVFKFQDYYFFATSQIRKPEVGIWLWILGSEKIAKKFRVVIRLGDGIKSCTSKLPQSQKKISLLWEGPVHTIRTSADDVMDSGECMVTSLTTVKSLCIHRPARDASVYWEVQFEITEV